VSIGNGNGTETAYVANSFDDSISVISVQNNTKIKDIPVGKGPNSIADTSGKVYVANTGSNTVSVISVQNNTKIKDIPVGKGPYNIAIPFLDTKYVYVTNNDSNTVSVISVQNNTKIKDIPVGKGPKDIAIPFLDTKYVYVANTGSNTVSVISVQNNTKIKDIPVGKGPKDIAVVSSKVYVANTGSNTVSVISVKNNTKIKDIPVGNWPIFVANYVEGKTIYVANAGSDGISVIDDVTDKVAAKIIFNINPPNSGNIICNNNLNSPLNQSFYVSSGMECIASPNKGFEFLSWAENLNNNSTITIKRPTYHNYFLDSVLDLFGVKPNDPAATLNVTQFGSFTANFKALPPPLPPEYWGTLFTVVASALVGTWLLPSIISWTKSKMQHRNLRQYRKRIDYLLKNSKSDNLIEYETADELKNDITTAYSRGKLNELQYKIAQEEILQYYHDSISKTIDSLKNVSNRNNDEYTQALDKARKQLTDVYSQVKVNSEHYVNLMNEISVLYEEMYDKRINSLYGKSHKENHMLLDKIKTDLTDTYAKGKISEFHYNLLNKKLTEYEKNTYDDSRTS
jgi:YVTN family beta-propeller protein